jgi:hypothetical protein
MALIKIKQYDTGVFALSEDNEWVCTHEDAYIERACCSGYDSEGLPSCGCHGQDGVICPAIDCTDIQEWEIDGLFDRLEGDPYYE